MYPMAMSPEPFLQINHDMVTKDSAMPCIITIKL